jgi:Thioredoxin
VRGEPQNPKQTTAKSKKTLSIGLGVAIGLGLAVIATALVVDGHTGGQAAAGDRPIRRATENEVDRTVSALFAGIPQAGTTLGRRTAHTTMEVFVDLEDPTSRWWFREDLPAIIDGYVRTGALKLRYRAFKRNTYWPAVFISQQTAALAAGAQNKLWDYMDTFFYEQGKELTHYVTDRYLTSIARQTPGLNLTRWQIDRSTGRREEQTAAEDQAARAIGLHVTPAFRIGTTGGSMSILTGRTTIRYPEQTHPIALIEAPEIANAIRDLGHNSRLPRTSQANPKILHYRLE